MTLLPPSAGEEERLAAPVLQTPGIGQGGGAGELRVSGIAARLPSYGVFLLRLRMSLDSPLL